MGRRSRLRDSFVGNEITLWASPRSGGSIRGQHMCALLMHGVALPTYGLTPENLDPDLPLTNHIMEVPQKLGEGVVLMNAFGFGGTNASIVFGRGG
jgi:3-oxoacyl-(acyl-carrier-protein) synthase